MDDYSLNIFDSHAHVDYIENLDQSIIESKKAGVIGIVAPGQNPASNKKVLELSKKYKNYIFPAIGYHPWDINLENYENELHQIDKNIDQYIALGEVGLDYKAKAKKKIQKIIFHFLLEIAKKHNKPVIVHTRYVHETSFLMVKQSGIKNAVFHHYNGSIDVLNRIIKSGYYISAAPSIVFNDSHAKAIFEAPITSILLETDSPVRFRTLESRPKHIKITLENVAKIKKMSINDVAEMTIKNSLKCFNLNL